jgi:hypothetical protein
MEYHARRLKTTTDDGVAWAALCLYAIHYQLSIIHHRLVMAGGRALRQTTRKGGGYV